MKIIKRFWNWVRFGNVRAEVISVKDGYFRKQPVFDQEGRIRGWDQLWVGGAVTEVVYFDRHNVVCGRWVAGSFDTALPYRG